MPTYYFIGLMYINGCQGNDRRVLIPDGSNDKDIQPPLQATLVVAKDEYKGDTFDSSQQRTRTLNVDGQEKEFLEFILKKRSQVTVPATGPTECSKLETGLPRAQLALFEPNLVTPDTIAEIHADVGFLKAHSLDGVAIVEWTFQTSGRGDVTITAKVLDDARNPTGQEQTLTVAADATVAFVHSTDLFADARPPLDSTPQDERWMRAWGTPAPTAAAASLPLPAYDRKGARLYSKIATKAVDAKLFTFNRPF
jgi:hypothetical protein